MQLTGVPTKTRGSSRGKKPEKRFRWPLLDAWKRTSPSLRDFKVFCFFSALLILSLGTCGTYTIINGKDQAEVNSREYESVKNIRIGQTYRSRNVGFKLLNIKDDAAILQPLIRENEGQAFVEVGDPIAVKKGIQRHEIRDEGRRIIIESIGQNSVEMEIKGIIEIRALR